MAIDFPASSASPWTNSETGITYTWNDAKKLWEANVASIPADDAYVEVAGDTMTGALVVQDNITLTGKVTSAATQSGDIDTICTTKGYVDNAVSASEGSETGRLDGRYVQVAGDNMAGNLTFDTNKIVLGVNGIIDSARVNVKAADGATNVFAAYTGNTVSSIWNAAGDLRLGNLSGGGNINLNGNDGSASFAERVDIKGGVTVDGGSSLSTGLYYRDDTETYGLALYSKGSFESNRKVFIKTDGSAEFAANVEARNFEGKRPGTNLDVFAGYAGSTLTSQINADGSAEFAGGDTVITDSGNVKCGDFDDDVGSFIGSAGTIAVRKDGGGSADVMLGVYNGGTTAGSLVSRVNGDGSAEFSAKVETIGANAAFHVGTDKDSNKVPLNIYDTANGNTSLARVNGNGSADFAGRVNAGGSSADPVQNEPGLAAYNDDGGTTATIFGNNLDSSGTGRLLDLRSNNVAKVIVGADGAVTFSGNISGGEGANFSGGIVSNFRGNADQYCFGAGQVSVDGPGLNSENAWITAGGSATFAGDVEIGTNINLQGNAGRITTWKGDGAGADDFGFDLAVGGSSTNAAALMTLKAASTSTADVITVKQGNTKKAAISADGSAQFAGRDLTIANDGTLSISTSFGGSGLIQLSDKIALNGANGSAEFENPSVGAYTYISNKPAATNFCISGGNVSDPKVVTWYIRPDGSATFGGAINSGSGIYSNAPSGGSISFQAIGLDDTPYFTVKTFSSNELVLIGGDQSTNTGNITLQGQDGSATFAGRVNSESIVCSLDRNTTGASVCELEGFLSGTNKGKFIYNNIGQLQLRDGSNTTNVEISSDGSAEFAGTVTANGSILTRSSGTLDVGDRLEKVDAALQSLKVAVTSNSTLDELRAAIISALTDV